MKKTLVICWVYKGWHPTQVYGDYFINHEIRIPSFTNQDSMESNKGFFRGSDGLSTLWTQDFGVGIKSQDDQPWNLCPNHLLFYVGNVVPQTEDSRGPLKISVPARIGGSTTQFKVKLIKVDSSTAIFGTKIQTWFHLTIGLVCVNPSTLPKTSIEPKKSPLWTGMAFSKTAFWSFIPALGSVSLLVLKMVGKKTYSPNGATKTNPRQPLFKMDGNGVVKHPFFIVMIWSYPTKTTIQNSLEVNHHFKTWWFFLEDDKPLLK